MTTPSHLPAPRPPTALEVDDGIATLSLDRPERFNAVDIEMAASLASHAERLMHDPSFRVVIIGGRGAAFCAGGDLRFLASRRNDLPRTVRELLHHHHRFLIALRMSPKIVITRLHGAVAGAGLSLAFMGDLAVAADDARFVPGYAKLGISPDGGGTVGLVDRIGPARALRLLLAEDTISARDAEALGLVDELAPVGALDGRVAELARRFASRAPAAIEATKRLVRREQDGVLAERLHAEQEELIRCMATPEFVHALEAFGQGRASASRDVVER